MTIQEVNLHLLKTRTLLLLYVISPSSVRPSQIISIIYRAKLRSHPFPNVRSPGEKRAGLIFFGHGSDNKKVHPCLYYFFFCSIFCIIKFGSNCTIFLLLLLLSAHSIYWMDPSRFQRWKLYSFGKEPKIFPAIHAIADDLVLANVNWFDGGARATHFNHHHPPNKSAEQQQHSLWWWPIAKVSP